MGRNTQGVRLIRLDDEDRLVGIERVEALGNGHDEDADESESTEGQ
jgi:DNA gyrase subunit A